MDPKSGKPRLFNPLSIWTDIALKSGAAMLDAAQAAVARPKVPKVAILPDADAPAPKPRKAKARKRRASASRASASRTGKNASSRARRRGR